MLNFNTLNKILDGCDIRVALEESVESQKQSEKISSLIDNFNQINESVAGMDTVEKDAIEELLTQWLGSDNSSWDWKTIQTSGVYTIRIKKNPIADFKNPIFLEKDGNILNLEYYFEPADEYLTASGEVTFNGLKAAIRDLSNQEKFAIDDYEQSQLEDY